MIFNYSFGLELCKNNPKISKKILLALGIAANLALLGYFKYSDFLIGNVNFAFGMQIPHLNLLLPLAISFFTFQQIAYLVDSAAEESAKRYDFLNYCLFVTFFPQLIAGPIVHHEEMMPQFAKTKNKIINYKNIALGLFIFSIGLFKKVVIADTFAIWATEGFDRAASLNLIEAWVTSLSYTFQLYFDFSGYCDMAIGAALLFNIKLPINFNSPYKALNIQDFWRRWHITLSRFLRDYVYIPLGGNRRGKVRTYVNLAATFLIGGIWHGAGWTFVFWGCLHGAALVVQRIWSELGFRLNKFVAWFITFNFVNIAWVFFRAKEWDDALKVLKGMFGLGGGLALNSRLEKKVGFLREYGVKFGEWNPNIQIDSTNTLLYYLIAGFAVTLLFKNSAQKLQGFRLGRLNLTLAVLCFTLGVLNLHKMSQFLYFNF